MKKAFLLLLALASTASAASPSFRGCRFDEGERSLQCKVRSLQSDEMDAQRSVKGISESHMHISAQQCANWN